MKTFFVLFGLGVFVFIIGFLMFSPSDAEKKLSEYFDEEKSCVLDEFNKLQRSNNEYTRTLAELYIGIVQNLSYDVDQESRTLFGYIVRVKSWTEESPELEDEEEKYEVPFIGRPKYMGDINLQVSKFIAFCVSGICSDLENPDLMLCYEACDDVAEILGQTHACEENEYSSKPWIENNEDRDQDINQPTNPINRHYCGDGTCSYGESCSSCSVDCGLCPEPEGIDNKIKQSIVWVKYDVAGKYADGSYFEHSSTGSGVIVDNRDKELTIYTNRHVVDCEYNEECFQKIYEHIKVRTQDGKMHDADRVSFSESDVDLAILRVRTQDARNYDFAYYIDEFSIGDKVTAIGYPSYAKNVVEFSVSKGEITNIKEVLSQSTGDPFRVIESDAYTYFGSSGGGLFNDQGNLVGINTWLYGTETSIAIDFNSIREQNFIYCDSASYFAEGRCYEYCDREQVMGDDRACYAVCDDFYCNSKQPSANDPRCLDAGYIAGSDGYCHLPCGSPDNYCVRVDSICLNNRCYPQCAQGDLWEDGTCRFYE